MQLTSRQVKLMGTTIDTRIYHNNPQPILAEVETLLRDYEQRFSANKETSELMQINRAAGQEPVSVSSDLYELIKIGKNHSLVAGSHLNIAIGPLIQTWRIGFKDAKLPSPEEIQALLNIINPADILLNDEDKSVYLAKTGMKIDLGALAKGYIADRIVAFLKSAQVISGLINLGGNVLTFGPALHNPDLRWRIGIQDPRKPRGHNLSILSIANQSVVTSGIYERIFTYDGETYHHIFDSHTGYPVDCETASLTIVSDLSLDGEIWTTRLFGKSPNDILSEIQGEKGLEALIISKNSQLIASPSLEKIRFV
ncbi:FAD:protein FMN transferase [Streptococcus dentapri]|uniref:FAD:protein FMN transferase n=1 Tax=Streptococcus dentapri TaxID=573564 RepID=A0ABV8D2R6_9STRE